MKTPTEIHPGLTEERLRIVAKVIRQARHEAVVRHEPSIGDNEWVLGCRCYAFTCAALRRIQPDHAEWLSILEGAAGGLRFAFQIAGVPLRFYRGDPEDIPKNKAARSFPEIHAMQDAFEFARNYGLKPHAFRIAVETDNMGEATEISLVQVDKNSEPVGERWVIAEEVPDNVAQFPAKEKEKELGKPPVGSRKKKDEQKEEGDE